MPWRGAQEQTVHLSLALAVVYHEGISAQFAILVRQVEATPNQRSQQSRMKPSEKPAYLFVIPPF